MVVNKVCLLRTLLLLLSVAQPGNSCVPLQVLLSADVTEGCAFHLHSMTSPVHRWDW